jgi:hypothetical protein
MHGHGIYYSGPASATFFFQGRLGYSTEIDMYTYKLIISDIWTVWMFCQEFRSGETMETTF